MEAKFDIYDTELLEIIVARTNKLKNKIWYSPADAEGYIKDIDKAWDEYKARFEAYKTLYYEKEKGK